MSQARFRKMTDTELANYYVDVCAYHDKPALDEAADIRKEIINRFVDRFADSMHEETEVENGEI